MERTAGFAVAALDAFACFDFKFIIMTFCHLISGEGKVIIFIDHAHIEPFRTWLAVVAVHTDPVRILRRELPDYRVVICRIDAEHDHIDQPGIQKPPDDLRIVGGQSQMTDYAIFFQ